MFWNGRSSGTIRSSVGAGSSNTSSDASPTEVINGLDGVELDGFDPALDLRLKQLSTAQSEAGQLGRVPRHDDRTIILLGHAFEPRAGIHRIPDRGNDLRPRWSHGAHDGIAAMDADTDPQRLRQIPLEPVVELVQAA